MKNKLEELIKIHGKPDQIDLGRESFKILAEELNIDLSFGDSFYTRCVFEWDGISILMVNGAKRLVYYYTNKRGKKSNDLHKNAKILIDL